MATPSQVRKERKEVLRAVKNDLRTLDSLGERLERMIARVLKVRKRFPDEQDAAQIVQSLTAMDRALDVVVKSASRFTNIVKAF